MLAVVDSQPLVFGADEDRRDDVSESTGWSTNTKDANELLVYAHEYAQ